MGAGSDSSTEAISSTCRDQSMSAETADVVGHTTIYLSGIYEGPMRDFCLQAK